LLGRQFLAWLGLADEKQKANDFGRTTMSKSNPFHDNRENGGGDCHSDTEECHSTMTTASTTTTTTMDISLDRSHFSSETTSLIFHSDANGATSNRQTTQEDTLCSYGTATTATDSMSSWNTQEQTRPSPKPKHAGFAFYSSDRRHTFHKQQCLASTSLLHVNHRIRDVVVSLTHWPFRRNCIMSSSSQIDCCEEKTIKSLDKKHKHNNNPTKYNDLLKDQSKVHVSVNSWKVATLVSVLVVLVAYCWNAIKPYNRLTRFSLPADLLPEWEWDRNVYFPAASPQEDGAAAIQNTNKRLSLIAAVTPEKPLKRLTDVSSRVNRAYARQWQMDYTEYSAGFQLHNEKACFSKAYVLKTIVEMDQKQQQQYESSHSDGSSAPQLLWPTPTRVRYDAIVLLPSDAIILDLDQNVVESMLPRDKLAAISGWDQTIDKLPSNSGVVLVNLHHEFAGPVAALWWEKSQNPSQSCGADNGLNLLIDAIAELFAETTGSGSGINDHSDGEDEPKQQHWTDLIEPIREHSNGVLGDQSIKVIPGLVPGDRIDFLSRNLDACSQTLQQTTDSVCYRFYPRCEVVP
jgi:hypothetical protein